ncbi:MAG: HEAT repeat domain-containing protein [Nitrospirales bacterium]
MRRITTQLRRPRLIILLQTCLVLAVLSPIPARGQVRVTVQASKPQYLAGEPIFLVVKVMNVGSESLGYSYGDGRVDLKVRNGVLRKTPRLRGCFVGEGGGIGSGATHPPQFKPGESVSFQYLLRGYELEPGEIEVDISGKAGVRWTYPSLARPNAALPAHLPTDPVDGREFDTRVKVTLVKPSNERELRRVLAPLIAESLSSEPDRRFRAREALSEVAPVFLEKTFAGFARDPESSGSAIAVLARINTPESRKTLRSLFAETTNQGTRSWIVENLARTGHPSNLKFFVGLLQGNTAQGNERIGEYAALGLGYLGGDKAAIALSAALRESSRSLRSSIAVALGNTRSISAVPVLMGLYQNQDLRNDVCGSLITLTHRQWCDGSGDVQALQVRWKQWWKVNRPGVRLYGPGQCPENFGSLPYVR